MPNRILREGILTSERVNRLGLAAEVFYRRLMSVVDDFGRFDARPSILRVSCYPLRVDSIREADISRLLAEVQEAGLIALYEVDGKPYLQLLDFRQQVRSKASKYPAPDGQVQTACAADATQMHSRCYAHAHLDGDGDGDGDGGDVSRASAPPTRANGRKKAVKVPLPPGWEPSEKAVEWARDFLEANGLSAEWGQKQHSLFIDKAKANQWRYADWDAAWRGFIRENGPGGRFEKATR